MAAVFTGAAPPPPTPGAGKRGEQFLTALQGQQPRDNNGLRNFQQLRTVSSNFLRFPPRGLLREI
eukprot:11203831-Alexandrium_andersonii.AAC.1